NRAPHLVLFDDTAPAEIYPLSLHDALPISLGRHVGTGDMQVADQHGANRCGASGEPGKGDCNPPNDGIGHGVMPGLGANTERGRSEEHTSELQSRENLVCRLLLEKKKNNAL